MKILKLSIFAAAVLALSASALITVNAEGNYSFPYNPDTGFDVPYTVVTPDELQEPEYEIGEIRSANRESTMLLPNKNILSVEIPWTEIHYTGSGDVHRTQTHGVWVSTNEEGERTVESFEYDSVPVYYKNRLFAKDKHYIRCLDADTLSVEQIYTYDGGYYPFEADTRTIFESDGGYEFTPGNFIRSRRISYYPENLKNHMCIGQESGYFGFSCDGIYYINVKKPEAGGVILHYVVNGEDCIVFNLSDEQYISYKFSDLQQLWYEYTQSALYVFVNDVRLAFDIPPVIKEGTTLMPLRFLLETIGADVKWDEDTNSAVIKYNGNEIKITAGSSIAYINEASYTLNIPSEIIDDKMMIPLRFVSEGLGMDVAWDEASRSVFIDVPADNTNAGIKLFSEIDFVEEGIYINGEEVKAVNSDGRTFIPLPILVKYFDIKNDNVKKFSNQSDIEMSKKAVPDENINLATKYIYQDYDKLSMSYINKQKIHLKYKNQSIPLYMFGNELMVYIAYGHYVFDPVVYSQDSYGNLICLEEAADMMDCLHYNWDGEENKLYIYIQDDMVTYDNALKAILDKRNISYDEEYTGDYYIDIAQAQEVSENDLSKLVQAGIKVGIIRESDYPDHHMRPTRNISHIDLARMLGNIGYNYTYDICDKDKPITQEEFNSIIKDLDLL